MGVVGGEGMGWNAIAGYEGKAAALCTPHF